MKTQASEEKMLKLVSVALLTLTMVGCSSFQRRHPNQEDMNVVLKDKEGKVVSSSGRPVVSSNGKEVTLIRPDEAIQVAESKDASEKAVPAAAAEVTTAVAAAAEHISNTHGKPASQDRVLGKVPASQALGWLKNGNTRFVKGFFRKDGASAKDRARIAMKETPHAVVVSSSDSRVPPEIIFDQKLGEIFTVRNAVAATDLGLISSVEYAVLDLGANLIVVLGNSAKDSWMNAARLSQELQDKSDILRDAIASGDVKIVTAMYDLGSGRVTWP